MSIRIQDIAKGSPADSPVRWCQKPAVRRGDGLEGAALSTAFQPGITQRCRIVPTPPAGKRPAPRIRAAVKLNTILLVTGRVFSGLFRSCRISSHTKSPVRRW